MKPWSERTGRGIAHFTLSVCKWVQTWSFLFPSPLVASGVLKVKHTPFYFLLGGKCCILLHSVVLCSGMWVRTGLPLLLMPLLVARWPEDLPLLLSLPPTLLLVLNWHVAHCLWPEDSCKGGGSIWFWLSASIWMFEPLFHPGNYRNSLLCFASHSLQPKAAMQCF